MATAQSPHPIRQAPQSLPLFRIRNLWVGDASVDLAIQRTKESVEITVLRKEGDVDVVSIK